MVVIANNEIEHADIGIYLGGCPNCYGAISDSRLTNSLPCTSCIPDVKSGSSFGEIIKLMDSLGTTKEFRKLYTADEEVKEMIAFFEKCVGSKPWNLQVMWLRRLVRGASFAMIAPTGVGKTTFGIVLSMYYATKGLKSYIVVPTTMLAMQIEKRFEDYIAKSGSYVNYLVIHSKIPRKERLLREERLERDDGFHILVTTSRYLLKNFSRILRHGFKFIFVDDVDAVLRGSKAVDLVIKLAGYDDSDIEAALKVLRLRRSLGADEEISRLEEMLRIKRAKNDRVVVVASATGNPKGIRVKLFRELLGFDVGARPEFLRNVYDTFLIPNNDRSIEEYVVEIVKKLGSGGLIYVPVDKGIDYAEYLAEVLNKHGIHSKALHSRNVKVVNEFLEGKISSLVGVATYYGVLVRGIDLPEIIRYAVFVGVPRHKIPLRTTALGPRDVLRLLTIMRSVVKEGGEKNELDRLILLLRRRLTRAYREALIRAKEVLSGVREAETALEKDLIRAYVKLQEYLSKPDIIDELKRHTEVAVVEEEGNLYVLLPDVATYVQASGRTSRLFAGGISRGLSLVIVDDLRLLKGLESKARWLIDNFRFRNVADLDLDELINEIDLDRKLIKSVREGSINQFEISKTYKEFSSPITVLLIVESPNKARTIARFFGKPSLRDYSGLKVYEVSLGKYTLLITASGGHIYDLVGRLSSIESIYGVAYKAIGDGFKFIPLYAPIKKCLKCGYQFTDMIDECPICGSKVVRDSESVVKSMRDVAYEVDEVFIGTDPDTEGEKISYDLYVLLKPYARSVRRVEFHEVTRKAILQALNMPRDVNLDLVKAQVVRRVEDRWLGFSLSYLLQTDFWKNYCRENLRLSSDPRCGNGFNRNLSAGRVQTPVLGWVVKHYEDYINSKRKFLIINLSNSHIEIPLPKDLESIGDSDVLKVLVEVVSSELLEEELAPLPPYTTDTLLSDAALLLQIPAPQAMKLLQDLFETGFITYHRTDSTRVSDVGISIAREYLNTFLGSNSDKYFAPRVWGHEGAHECIRPTRPADLETVLKLVSEGILEPATRLSKKHLSLYNLIFSRFIASQSKPAVIRKQKLQLNISLVLNNGTVLKVNDSPIALENPVDIVFDGFARFYKYFRVSSFIHEGVYEVLKGNFRLVVRGSTQLLTQARLISMMKKEGIGRPSTYAKILETLFKRNYVIESRRRGYLIPTQLGVRVYYYLTERFSSLVSEGRTKELEKKMDMIEEGSIRYMDVLNELYDELFSHKLVKVLS
ncbi:MAG: reverse gyrase [Sulfolobales archaeon]|nr:reverse gyrase [Sulfolobales archaeon]